MTTFQPRFDGIARLYDQVRPGYLPETVEVIATEARLQHDSRILEVGCGGGKMTVALATRGYTIVALEPARQMGAIASRRCAAYPRVTITPATFEDFIVPPRAFDLLLAAQSFHWIDATRGMVQAARALKPKGTIALIWHLDVSPRTDFWAATRSTYRRYFPCRPSETHDPLVAKADRCRQNLERCQEFDRVRSFRQPWQRCYTDRQYVRLLRTFSDVRALTQVDRRCFLAEMSAIVSGFGGVEKHYETLVLLANRA